MMSIGSAVRSLLGPAEPAIGRMYRGAFLDLAGFADGVRAWTDARSILEVGCGDGLATEQFQRAFPQAAITGIDIQERVGALYRGDPARVRFQTIDLESFVSRHPNAFDLVVVCDVVHHVPPPDRVPLLRLAAQALRSGGGLVLKDWERGANLAHLFAWLSDRFVTGSPVWFETAGGLRSLVVDALEVAPEREVRLRPWRNNVAFLIRPRQR